MNVDDASLCATELPPNVRVWVYTLLHQALERLNDMDLQLGLEVALDHIVQRRRLPDTLGVDPAPFLHMWQDHARNGFELYEVLNNWVPAEEQEVFRNVSHETLHACFATALILAREAGDLQNESPQSTPTPTLPDAPFAWKMWAWPVSVVAAAVLGALWGLSF